MGSKPPLITSFAFVILMIFYNILASDLITVTNSIYYKEHENYGNISIKWQHHIVSDLFHSVSNTYCC